MEKSVTFRLRTLGICALVGSIGIGAYYLYKHRLRYYIIHKDHVIDRTRRPLLWDESQDIACTGDGRHFIELECLGRGDILDQEMATLDDFEAQEREANLAASSPSPYRGGRAAITTSPSSSDEDDDDTGYGHGDGRPRSYIGTASSASQLTSGASSRAKLDHDKASGYVDVLVAALEDSESPGRVNGYYYGIESPEYKRVMGPRNQLLIRTLTTISNLSAFSENQVIFREAGCLNQLMRLLATSTDFGVLTACARCIANLSLNVENQFILRESTPLLLKLLFKGGIVPTSPGKFSADMNGRSLTKAKAMAGGSRFTVVALTALTNLAVLDPLVEAYNTNVVGRMYRLVEEMNYEVRLNALKLLVNLSCYDELVPVLLYAKASKHILSLLVDSTIDAQILIRSTTLLEHLLRFASKNGHLRSSGPLKDNAAPPTANGHGADAHYNAATAFEMSPGQSSWYEPSHHPPGSVLSFLSSSSASNGPSSPSPSSSFLKGKVCQLKCHRIEDIRENACKIYGYLNA